MPSIPLIPNAAGPARSPGQADLVPIVPPDGLRLFHGTTRWAARSILAHGFRWARAPSYTGTAANLSECLAVAYAYGAPEEGGRILEVRLGPAARCLDHVGGWRPGDGARYDEAFAAGRADAIRTFGGNVWLLRPGAPVAGIRTLAAGEARRLLAAEIRDAGPGMGYNGAVQAYALAIHGGCRGTSDEEDARLALAALRRAGAVPPSSGGSR